MIGREKRVFATQQYIRLFVMGTAALNVAGLARHTQSCYSDCQKNVPLAEGFFATTAYAAILLIGTYL
jgi:hypothetical protein